MKQIKLTLLSILVLTSFFKPVLAEVAKTKFIDKIVAIVNDEVITQSELNKRISTYRTQLRESGQNIPKPNILKQKVLEQTINLVLQLQLAKQMEIEVSEEELEKIIKDIADKNQVTLAELKHQVTRTGLSYKSYQSQIKEEYLIAQVQKKVAGHHIVVTEAEITKFIKTNKGKIRDLEYDIQFVRVPIGESPTTDDIKKAKSIAKSIQSKLKNAKSFSLSELSLTEDEKVAHEADLDWRKLPELPEIYVSALKTMKKGDISRPLRAPNGFHIIKLVNTKKMKPIELTRQTHTRHILLTTDAITSESEVISQLKEIKKRIKRGVSFEKIAQEISQDPGSAAKGGDLGWVNPGSMAPQFERTMNKTKVNQISEPVKTPFGWHIIQVLGRRQIDDTAQKERAQVKQMLMFRKFNEQIQQWLMELRGASYIKVIKKS